MTAMKRTWGITTLAAIAALALLASPAVAATHHKPRCKHGYTLKHRWGKHHHRRFWVCVRKHHAPAPITPTSTVSAAAPVTSTTSTSSAPSVPPVVRASVDPSFTQDASDPLRVTWQYSATGADGTPPAPGILALSVSQTGVAGPQGGCSMDVDPVTPGGSCTVELPQYGSWTVTVQYSGSTTATGQTSSETEMIEPPGRTVQETWGTTPPSASPTVSALVIGSTASVQVNDPNFEGATQIGVSDNAGDTCQATVSGTQATCSMTVLNPPTSFTLSYPGGVTQQSTQTVPPNGIQNVSYVWGADSVPIPHPTVTVQQAPVTWNGWAIQGGAHGSAAPPNPLAVNTGVQLNLFAFANGSLASDPNPQGYITFTVIQQPDPATYSATNEQAGGASTTDCQISQNFALQGVGGCSYVFSTLGTYVIRITFTSADANYGNEAGGLVETVNVS